MTSLTTVREWATLFFIFKSLDDVTHKCSLRAVLGHRTRCSLFLALFFGDPVTVLSFRISVKTLSFLGGNNFQKNNEYFKLWSCRRAKISPVSNPKNYVYFKLFNVNVVGNNNFQQKSVQSRQSSDFLIEGSTCIRLPVHLAPPIGFFELFKENGLNFGKSQFPFLATNASRWEAFALVSADHETFHHQFSELDENFCTWRENLYPDDEKFCTLTRKSVPWQENLYPDEIFCTWREFLYLDEKIWATDVQVHSELLKLI